MGITMLNIEHSMHLFQSKNSDFGSPSWAEPIVVGMIRAYQNDEEIDITIGNEYVRAMCLSEHRENRSYSPIECISSRQGLEAIATHLSGVMLQNFTQLSAEDLRDLRDYLHYLFLELMNNVADHSQSAVGGYAMAQYFPANRKIQFVVADRGVGFLANMALNFSSIGSEEEAIFKALEKGVTSTPETLYGQERNAGYGLYAMLEILKRTGGKFVIISNDTLVRYANNSYESKLLEHPWKGVVVSFEFDESKINFDMDHFRKNFLWNDLDDEEDFFA